MRFLLTQLASGLVTQIHTCKMMRERRNEVKKNMENQEILNIEEKEWRKRGHVDVGKEDEAKVEERR